MLAPVSKTSKLIDLIQPEWSENEKTQYSEYFELILRKRLPVDINNIKNNNNKYALQQVQKNIISLPPLNIPVFELDISEFHPIPIESHEEDSHELKGIIYSFNRKIAQMVCDHSNLQKLQLEYNRDLIGLFGSPNYKPIKEYLASLVNACVRIEKCDKTNGNFLQSSEAGLIHPIYLDKVKSYYLKFGQEILDFQAKYQQTRCPKCAKNESEYNAMVAEVEQRRLDEKREYEAGIRRIQAEVNVDMNQFVETYFQNEKRIKLSLIVRMWKQVNKGKSSITQNEVAAQLEETGKWRITHPKNVYFATKIEGDK